MGLLAKLFQQLLTMSVTALPIMAVVLVVRWAMSRAPKKYGYLLWVVVALRLICPVMPESPIGIVSPVDTAKQVEVVADAYLEPTLIYTDNGGFTPDYDVLLNRGYTPNEKGEIVTNEAGTREAFQVRDLMPAAVVIWLAGVAVGLCYIVVSFWRLRRNVATAVRWQDNVWQSDNIPTPFVLGWFKPSIYIPFRMDERERTYVLAHEQYHIHRGDHWAKTLALALLVVYWWNPTVWLCWVLFCRDMEMSCDEAVLAQLGSDVKQSYSMSLVSFALDRRFPAALAFGEHDAVRRVKHVLNWKQAKPAVAFLAVAAVIIVVAVCGTNANSNGRVFATDIAEGYYREGVQIEYRMPRRVKKWAIYQDVYDNGKLVSSTLCVSDGFEEDGTGATPRKGTMKVFVSPESFEGASISGNLNCRYVGAGELEWNLQLPRELYSNMTGCFGRAESRTYTWTMEPGAEILLYNVVLSEDGTIAFADHPVGLTKRNDTVVQYWLATSTDEEPVFTEKPLDLAQSLYDLRIETLDYPSRLDEIRALLDAIGVSELGDYEVLLYDASDGRTSLDAKLGEGFWPGDSETYLGEGGLLIRFLNPEDKEKTKGKWEGISYLLQTLAPALQAAEYSYPDPTGGNVYMQLFSESDWLAEQLGYGSLSELGKSPEGIRVLLNEIAGWEHNAQQNDSAWELYELRVNTVEDSDAVEKLLEYLNISALGTYAIETFQSADDMVLHITFDSTLDEQQESEMWENTCLLMALVKDIERVDYSFPTESGSSTMTIYSEGAPLNNWAEKLGYEDVKDMGRSVKGIRNLIDYVGWTRLVGGSVVGELTSCQHVPGQFIAREWKEAPNPDLDQYTIREQRWDRYICAQCGEEFEIESASRLIPDDKKEYPLREFVSEDDFEDPVATAVKLLSRSFHFDPDDYTSTVSQNDDFWNITFDGEHHYVVELTPKLPYPQTLCEFRRVPPGGYGEVEILAEGELVDIAEEALWSAYALESEGAQIELIRGEDKICVQFVFSDTAIFHVRIHTGDLKPSGILFFHDLVTAQQAMYDIQ